ncbi:hypothetical protein AciX9_3340 [Granulicella tundricola MP5ACTX9]|uniref:Uncharacterized protein n=1 Tax=Granulicella tundricola (strain ATCC BAA-1859 / DSM 23138 / MP5ACTX9) TaxID=1198114 RepID=E8X2Q1_GRATM|nr:hypothetical protein AciX9_3340 [Granulicella tundricola MP5ACTX9]
MHRVERKVLAVTTFERTRNVCHFQLEDTTAGYVCFSRAVLMNNVLGGGVFAAIERWSALYLFLEREGVQLCWH